MLLPIIDCTISAKTLMDAIVLYQEEVDPDATYSDDDLYQAPIRLSQVATDLTLTCPAYNVAGGKDKARPKAMSWVCAHVVKPNPHSTLVELYDLLRGRALDLINTPGAYNSTPISAEQLDTATDLEALAFCMRIIADVLNSVDARLPRINAESKSDLAMAQDILHYLCDRSVAMDTKIYANNVCLTKAHSWNWPANCLSKYRDLWNIEYNTQSPVVHSSGHADLVICAGDFLYDELTEEDSDDHIKRKLDHIARIYGYAGFDRVDSVTLVATYNPDMVS